MIGFTARPQVVGDFNIANGFNEFFARVGPELARKFDDVDPKAFEQYLPPPHSAETFTFCKVTGEILLKSPWGNAKQM